MTEYKTYSVEYVEALEDVVAAAQEALELITKYPDRPNSQSVSIAEVALRSVSGRQPEQPGLIKSACPCGDPTHCGTANGRQNKTT